jgi:hypothetical protein
MFSFLRRATTARTPQRKRSFRPHLELLEDRTLPSTGVVPEPLSTGNPALIADATPVQEIPFAISALKGHYVGGQFDPKSGKMAGVQWEVTPVENRRAAVTMTFADGSMASGSISVAEDFQVAGEMKGVGSDTKYLVHGSFVKAQNNTLVFTGQLQTVAPPAPGATPAGPPTVVPDGPPAVTELALSQTTPDPVGFDITSFYQSVDGSQQAGLSRSDTSNDISGTITVPVNGIEVQFTIVTGTISADAGVHLLAEAAGGLVLEVNATYTEQLFPGPVVTHGGPTFIFTQRISGSYILSEVNGDVSLGGPSQLTQVAMGDFEVISSVTIQIGGPNPHLF